MMSGRDLFMWNPVYEFCMNLKDLYRRKYAGKINYNNNIKTNRRPNGETCLEYWAECVTNINPKYLRIIDNLQISQREKCVIIHYAPYNKLFEKFGIRYTEFWNEYHGFYRECRGIVIDLEREEIVLLPFAKFMNIDECPENSMDVIKKEIKKAKSIEVTNKLDGSMFCFGRHNRDYYASTSKAIDPNKSPVLSGALSHITKTHKKMAREYPYYTFIFEYISPKYPLVVKYPKEQEGIYLIGIRDVLSGKQLPYKEVTEIADEFNIPMTEVFNKTFDEVLADIKVKKSSEMEGFVLNIDGHMVKVKCDDYVALHGVLSKLTAPNNIIRCIADGTYDDLLSKVPNFHRATVEGIAEEVRTYIKRMGIEVDAWLNLAPKDNIKTFMYWANTVVPATHRVYVRKKYLGEEFSFIKSGSDGSPKYKKISEIRNYLVKKP